jgi:hypothetical protein
MGSIQSHSPDREDFGRGLRAEIIERRQEFLEARNAYFGE